MFAIVMMLYLENRYKGTKKNANIQELSKSLILNFKKNCISHKKILSLHSKLHFEA